MIENHEMGGSLTINDAGTCFDIKTNSADGIEVCLQKTKMKLESYKETNDWLLVTTKESITWDTTQNQITQERIYQSDEHFTGLGHGAYGRANTIMIKA